MEDLVRIRVRKFKSFRLENLNRTDPENYNLLSFEITKFLL
jgi:hypothetical protein